MVWSLVSGGYRTCIAEMSEHTFRITLRAILVDFIHEVNHISAHGRLFDEFRLVLQDGFELEHA